MNNRFINRPTGSPKYGATRKNIPRYYTLYRLIRYMYHGFCQSDISDIFSVSETIHHASVMICYSAGLLARGLDVFMTICYARIWNDFANIWCIREDLL